MYVHMSMHVSVHKRACTVRVYVRVCMCVYVCACVSVCGLGLGDIENNTQQLLQQSHCDYYHNIALKYFTIIN